MPYYHGKKVSPKKYIELKYSNLHQKHLNDKLEKFKERMAKNKKTYKCKKCDFGFKIPPRFHICGKCWDRFQKIERFLEKWDITDLSVKIKKVGRLR